jgi:hypothetical protein
MIIYFTFSYRSQTRCKDTKTSFAARHLTTIVMNILSLRLFFALFAPFLGFFNIPRH